MKLYKFFTFLVLIFYLLNSTYSINISDENYQNILTDLKNNKSIKIIIELENNSNYLNYDSNDYNNIFSIYSKKSKFLKVETKIISNLKLDSKNIKKSEKLNFISISINSSNINKLLNISGIISIRKDRIYHPSLLQSLKKIGANTTQSLGYGGLGQTVAILDTGFESNHSMLSGKIISQACYSTNSVGSISLCSGAVSSSISIGSAFACSGLVGCDHGTHVSGIAIGNNGTYFGVAPNSTMIGIQVFSNISGSLGAYESDIILGLQRVLNLTSIYNISAVSLSFGSGLYTSTCDLINPTLKSIIDQLKAKGIPTIVASGNDFNSSAIAHPACISTAISIGSTSNLDFVSSFSNSASFLDFLAPGENIISSIPGNSYTSLSGTSMATPHVSGAWSVLKSTFPYANYSQIYNALKSTGTLITDLRNSITTPRINLDLALTNILVLRKNSINTTSNALVNWQNSSFNITLFPITIPNSILVNYTSFKINGSSFQNGTNIVINTSGIFNISYFSVNNLNVIESLKNISVYLDLLSPNTSTNAPLGWQNSSFNISLNGFDSLSGINHTSFKINGSSFQNGTNIVINTSGIFNISYFSTDNAGNLESIKNLSVYLDLISPNTSNNAPLYWQNSSFNISLNGFDSLSGINHTSFKINGSSFQNGTNIVINTSGIFNISYFSIDNAGNFELTKNISVYLDLLFPNTSNNAPLGWQNASFNISLNGFDSLSGINYTNFQINNASFQNGTNIEINSSGIFNISYFSTDNAGNFEPTKNFTVYLDLLAPQIINRNILTPNTYRINKNYSFNIELLDQIGISNSTLIFNNSRYLMINTSNTSYYFIFNNLSIGVYNYSFEIIDTFNHKLTTNTEIFEILNLTNNQAIVNSSNFTIIENITNLIMPKYTNINLINMSSNISNSLPIFLNFSNNILNGSINLLNSINLVRNYNSTINSINFLNQTQMISNSNWDGNFLIQTISNKTFTIASGTVDFVLEIGSNDFNINLSKPVKINLSNNLGKFPAFSFNSSILTPINLICDNLENPTNINNLSSRQCYIFSNNDLIIWTYHLTNFAAYTKIISSGVTPPSNSGGSSGGGGGSFGANNQIITPIIIIENTPSINNLTNNTFKIKPVISKKILELKNMTKEKFVILIDNISYTNTSLNFSGTKKIQLKDKKTNKKVVEFNFNFSEDLDLSNLEIKSENLSKNNYIIISGLELKNQTKTIILPIIDNTNTICIKDTNLNSISQISKNCTGINEYILTCNNKKDSNGYNCLIENSTYIISGLKHSGVLEFPAIKTKINPISNISILKISSKGNESLNSSSKISKITYFDISKSSLYIFAVIILIIILIVIFVLIKRKNKENYHILKENKKITTKISSVDEINYNKIKDYIKNYKNSYSKAQIYNTLKDNNFSDELISKVFDENYK